MSLAYGWLPKDINGLTIYQAMYYLGVPVPEMGTMKKDDYEAWFGPMQMRRQVRG